MKKLLVYPYDGSFEYILSYIKLVKNLFPFELKSLVAPKGWGYKGSICIDNLKIEIGEDFEEAILKCDAVLIRDSNFPVNFKKSILSKIIFANELEKEIVFCRRSKDELIELQSIIQKDRLNFSTFYHDYNSKYLREMIYEINVPTICICGMLSNVNKTQTEILLSMAFRSKGYKVSCVYCANEMAYLGEYVWPTFIYECYSSKKKILNINHYLKDIVAKENPDLIIFIIPGEIMEISTKCVENFGLLAIEFSKACTPDCIIVNSILGNMSQELCNDISNHAKALFEKEVDFFNAVPLLLRMDESNNRNVPQLLQVDEDFIKQELNGRQNSNVVQICDFESAMVVVEKIIDKLS